MECWSTGVVENGSVSDRTVDRAVGSPNRSPQHLQPATRVQFGLGAILPHSNTPSLRVAGFEDEDEYEAPGEGGSLTDVTQG